MNPIASYSFLPWLRQGIANTITAKDHDPSVKLRASIHVELTLQGDPTTDGPELKQTISQDIALYGPGDIIGVDQRAIFRTEPRNWVTNFESNYLAAIDFYDEDFPWRYTPAAPDSSGRKLRPWLTLIVLQASEFTTGATGTTQPLPFITVTGTDVYPPADDLWAWAHVHFNKSLGATPAEIVSTDVNSLLQRVSSVLAANPDDGYSRIICPRRLADNTSYHAFLIPTFETGRLAGLGVDPGGAPSATTAAWEAYNGKPSTTSMPYYYRWDFSTGSKGDFEYLVSLLTPQPVDSRVGTRDMDVQNPGSNLPGITDPALGGVLKLGGAFRVPDADLSAADLTLRQKYENWDQPYPTAFQNALAAFINLPDDYAVQASATANAASGLGPGINDDPDPLITAPLYGCWHALTQRLLTNRDGTPAPNNSNWVHQLNLDPRYRVAAALGAGVVEANVEAYMNDAWQQIGDVLAANARIRTLQLATEVSAQWYVAHLNPLNIVNPERALAWLAPVSRRVLLNGSTVTTTRAASLVPLALTSTAMRRVVRPGSRLMRNLPFTTTVNPDNLIARVNSGIVSAAPPKSVPTGLPMVDAAAAAAQPAGEPAWVKNLLAQFPWLTNALLIAFLIVAIVLLFAGALLALGIVAVILGYIWWQIQQWKSASTVAADIDEANQTPAAVAQLPSNPNFVLSAPGSNFQPVTGAVDSPTAVRFKTALVDWYTLLQASITVGERPAPAVLDLTTLTQTMVSAVNPRVTIPRRGISLVGIPDWIRAQIGNDFNEVMAYPKIDLPMYEPLKAMSNELLLPSMTLIARNSITLMETNQPFIEAYMVGLNHEFARKLLWREYPTDQRGSYFRQFWDVRAYLDSAALSQDALKEKLYDIPPLHLWPANSTLGQHNNRLPAGTTSEQAVLVIRGELLKKYPTAVIFAQRAVWVLKSDGTIDLTQPRSLVTLSQSEEANPPIDKLRTPLYEAKADPDIYFFGFDLTVAEAKGGPGTNKNDDPGWFFVIQERPGEPRFGLELDRTGAFNVFDELTWNDALPGGGAGSFLAANSLSAVPLVAPPTNNPEHSQYLDDKAANVSASSAARWAYMLFRAPVMIAVHASKLLT